MSEDLRRCYSSAAPGEKGYAAISSRPLDFMNDLNAEDFRFHAIRGRAYTTFIRLQSSMATPELFTRAQSDITSIRRHHEEVRALSPERDESGAAHLASVLEEVADSEQSIARPYLAWACSQLGVQDMYSDFEQRAGMRVVSLDSSSSDAQEEEEYSLDEMIEDVEVTRAASVWSDSNDSTAASPTRTARDGAGDESMG